MEVLNTSTTELNQFEAKTVKDNISTGSKVLCVGCGSGREVMALRDEGYKADGATLSENNVKFAKWNWDLNLFWCDMHVMTGILNETYDAIIAFLPSIKVTNSVYLF